MCYAAPGIINLLDRMGVMFNRTPEGLLDFRRFGGTKYHRTAFAGRDDRPAAALRARRAGAALRGRGLVRKYETWEFLGLVRDDAGNCRGIVALDWYSMKIEAFPATAVMLATGGPGIVFGRSTNSVINTGTAAARRVPGRRLLRQRRVHPGPSDVDPGQRQAAPHVRVGARRGRAHLGAADAGRQARAAAIPEKERWYFLEEKYPAYGNLVPRDIATREIFLDLPRTATASTASGRSIST